MTDTLDDVESPAPADVLACEVPDCGLTFDTKQRLGQHRWHAHGLRSSTPSKKKPRRDRPPTTVKIQVGAERAGKSDAAAKARVEQLVNMIAGSLAMAGQVEDAADIMRAREQFCLCVIELAKYEPWLKRLLEGGQASGRIMAWVAMALATLGMVLPIFNRHGWVPDELKPAAMALVGQATTAPADAAEPVAA